MAWPRASARRTGYEFPTLRQACLALKVARRINSLGVIEALADAMCLHGIPEHIRCDNVLRSEEGRLIGQQVSVREHALAA